MSTPLDISELIMASSKIPVLLGVADATNFVEKGTVWRKLLDSSLYDFSKWIFSKYPWKFELKSDRFKTFFDIVFQAWCGAFKHFELLKSTKIKCGPEKRLFFPAYMRYMVKTHLQNLRRQELQRKKLYPVSNS